MNWTEAKTFVWEKNNQEWALNKLSSAFKIAEIESKPLNGFFKTGLP